MIPRLAMAMLGGVLLMAAPAQAGWAIIGQPGSGQVGDGTEFTVANPELKFIVDSSLDNSTWWVSNNASPWLSDPMPITDPDTGGFLGMRVDDAVAAGGSFYQGISLDRQVLNSKMAFRIRYGANGGGRPPDGTQIFVGFSNFGAPSGAEWPTDSPVSPENQQAILNATHEGNYAGSEADPHLGGIVPAGFIAAHSWIHLEQKYGSKTPGTNREGSESTRIVLNFAGKEKPYTQMVAVIIFPEELEPGVPYAGYTPSSDPDNRMFFSWTIDGVTEGATGPENPDYGTLLVPEPSRALLISLALSLMILRRSRTRSV